MKKIYFLNMYWKDEVIFCVNKKNFFRKDSYKFTDIMSFEEIKELLKEYDIIIEDYIKEKEEYIESFKDRQSLIEVINKNEKLGEILYLERCELKYIEDYFNFKTKEKNQKEVLKCLNEKRFEKLKELNNDTNIDKNLLVSIICTLDKWFIEDGKYELYNYNNFVKVLRKILSKYELSHLEYLGEIEDSREVEILIGVKIANRIINYSITYLKYANLFVAWYEDSKEFYKEHEQEIKEFHKILEYGFPIYDCI